VRRDSFTSATPRFQCIASDENGAKVVRAFAAKILRKRFDKSTAALRAATFVQLVLGDAYLELSIGYTVPNVETRFALQIDEAVAAALR
jgi:TetR/AcrR family transcriptional repressor of mexJK operon